MKLFKYSLLAFAAVAVAAGFTACSDDDDFTPGAAVNGVCFEAEAPADIEVSKTATEFAVTLVRSGISDAANYGIVATTDAPEGTFTFPATVAFEAGAATADYVIGVEPALLDSTYTISLKFADGVSVSPYGLGEYSFTIKSAKAYTAWKPFATGTGCFNYALNFLFTGDDPELPIVYRENVDDANDVQLMIQHLYINQDILMEMDKAENEITIPAQPLYEDGEPIVVNVTNYGQVEMYVMDLYTYAVNFEPAAESQFKGASFYNEEEGCFYLAMAYVGRSIDDPSDWILLEGSYGYEFFQMDGFTNANVDIAYEGMYTDKSNNQFAMFTVSVGEAASKALVGASKTVKGDNLAYAIAAGSVEGVEVAPGENQAIQVPINGAGKYDAAIVSFIGDEPELYMVVSFTIKGVEGDTEDPDWKSHGVGEITDGWLSARYGWGQNGEYTFEDVPWDVMIEQSKHNPNVYRMINPWSDPNSTAVLSGYNQDPQEANVEFDCSNPNFVIMDPQYSGCSMTFSGELRPAKIDVGNYSSIVGMTNNNGDVITEEMIINNGLNSTFEEDVVYVPTGACLFGYNGQFGYTWRDKNNNPVGFSYIYVGDPNAELGARQKAQQRAKDRAKIAQALNPCGFQVELLPEGYKVRSKSVPTLKFKYRK